MQSVVVNDGSAQRSMVKSLTVTFDGSMTIDPGAFELSRQDGTLVDLSVATSILNGQTVAVLTFNGSGIVGGSLADGNYALTVRGDLVHDAFGRALDGDGDGTAGGDRSDAFFRLYGDSDGDRDVDLRDLGRFLSTFGRRAGDADYLCVLRRERRRPGRSDRPVRVRRPARHASEPVDERSAGGVLTAKQAPTGPAPPTHSLLRGVRLDPSLPVEHRRFSPPRCSPGKYVAYFGHIDRGLVGNVAGSSHSESREKFQIGL